MTDQVTKFELTVRGKSQQQIDHAMRLVARGVSLEGLKIQTDITGAFVAASDLIKFIDAMNLPLTKQQLKRRRQKAGKQLTD